MLTQAEKDTRLNFITGSDAAIICLPDNQRPKYLKTKLQLWMEKTKRVVEEDISGLNHIKFGTFFEEGVARWFEAESGKKVDFNHSKQDKFLLHKTIPWMSGTVDYKIIGENAILECKTAFSADEWGDGENTIPKHYLLQVAHYCAIGGFDRAYIAVVFKMTSEMRWYVYERDFALEAKLISHEKEFWEKHIVIDVCPEPATESDILLLYKETSATPVIADDAIAWKPQMLLRILKEIKELEEKASSLKTEIQLYMLDADTLLDNHGKVLASWKYSKPINRIDLDKLKKLHPAVHLECLKEFPAQRRFNVKGEAHE